MLRCPARCIEKTVSAGRALLFPSFSCGLVGPPQVMVVVQKREEGEKWRKVKALWVWVALASVLSANRSLEKGRRGLPRSTA